MTPLSAVAGRNAVVLDSPHSGTDYPADFGHDCDFATLRRAEDTHVEKLYAFAPALGCAWIEAHFPRSYVDANRGRGEIDPELLAEPWPEPIMGGAKVRLGKGLIWRLTDEGIPIYRRRLAVAEVQRRIERCWRPYHEATRRAIDEAHARHGFCIHLNCHSMPSRAAAYATEFPGETHPDFVVGNRDGATANAAVVALVRDHLAARRYDVRVNHPYKGVELVRRNGDPARHRHSVQLEVNRRLYMDEATLEPHAGFARLAADLASLVERLASFDPRAAT